MSEMEKLCADTGDSELQEIFAAWKVEGLLRMKWDRWQRDKNV